MHLFLILIPIVLSVLAGIYFGLRVNDQLGKFWFYLVAGLIFTSPLMVGGYTWYDEFYTVGFMLANIKFKRFSINRDLYFYIAVIFLGYMLVQSLRGVLFFTQFGLIESINKFRWLFFYALILLILVKISPKNFIIKDNFELAYALTKSGLFFGIGYSIVGLLAMYASGSVAYTQYAQIDSSGPQLFALFGATAYVVPVFIVLIPASLFVIKQGDRKKSKLAWIAMSLYFMNQLLYGSRSGILLFFIFLILFLTQHLATIKFSRSIISLIPVIGLIIFFGIYFNEQNISVIFEDLLNTLHIGDGRDDGLQDIDRRIWNAAALVALLDNTFNFFYGWGLRTSGYIIAPYVYDLFLEARGFAIFEQDVATPGFAALAIDGGIICILFVTFLMFKAAKSIFDFDRNSLIFLSFAPIAMVLQLFVVNITDVLLLWLSIIPGGLFSSFIRNMK